MIIRALHFALSLVVTSGPAPSAQRSSPLPAELTEVLHCHASRALLCDQLYPIGFSRDGKLAYLHIPADEAVGEYLWAFRIVDLVTDKVVAARDWQSAHSEQIQDLQTLLRHEGGELSALLRQCGIVALAEPRLREVPVPYGGGAVAVSLVEAAHPVRDPATDTRRLTHSIELRDARGRSKRIGAVTSLRDSGMQMTYPPKVLGYLRSPFEPRVAVILEQTHRGYEGPPNVSSFVLLGAHLRVGFSRHAD